MSVGLIDFLRNWGESLFSSKKAFVAHQSMPDDSSVTTVSQSGQDVTDYIAPFDGYAVLMANATNSGSIGLGLYSGSQNYGTVLTAPVDAGHTNSLIKPVAKGNSVRYYTYRNNLKDITLKFVRSIGGGYSSILQAIGGGLCHLSQPFNRFSICSSRSLKLNGSGTKQCRNSGKLNTTYQTEAQSLRHLTARLVYLLTADQQHQSKTDDCRRQISTPLFTAQKTTVCAIFVSGFRLLRGETSVFFSRVRERLRFVAIQPLVAGKSRLNPCFEGGAL